MFRLLKKKELKGDDLIDVTTQSYDDLIKSANLISSKINNNRASKTTNTVSKCANQQLDEEMCKFLMQLTSEFDSSTMAYNKTMNTSYVISASHTPTSISFVSQVSPSNHLLYNTDSHSKLATSELNDLPMSSALSFLSSTLYSSSRAFNEQQKPPPQSGIELNSILP